MKNNTSFHYNNAVKLNKNYMYNDLRRSNCYGTDFTGSNFNFASFRGGHFKSCNFYGCTFKYAEFVGTNLRKSKLRKAVFEDTLFEGTNLDGTDFRDAEFTNVIFVGCDLSKAKDLKFDEDEVSVFEEMPELHISEELEEAVKKAMENKFIKKSRVMDTREGEINSISIMRLQDKFNNKTLISGLKLLAEKIDKDFCTLSYIIKSIESYGKDGLI